VSHSILTGAWRIHCILLSVVFSRVRKDAAYGGTAMALKKREILQRVLDEIEPGKWNVAKPQDSEDPDTECILQRKADRKEVKLAIDNTRFRSNNIDDIKNLVESAINFPHLRTAAGAEMENAFPGADRRILGSDSGRGGGIGKIKKQRGTETINGKMS